MNVDNQVFELLFVHLEMFHDHVVAEPVSLIPILPVVHAVCKGLFILSIDVDTVPIEKQEIRFFRVNLQVERKHENHRATDGSVDVSTDVLIIEGNIHPSSCACEIRTH